jgi:ArsR family transcriptional regulator
MELAHDAQEQIIPALKALGEPNRLRILCSLGLECRPVTDIINATGLGQTNVSFHLRVLREAGFVRTERRGPFIHYCLIDSELLRILHDLKHWLDNREKANQEK